MTVRFDALTDAPPVSSRASKDKHSDGAPAGRRRAAANAMAGSASSVVIIALQSLALTPLFLRHVGQRLYGAWLGSGDVLLWLQAFDLGIPNLLIQRIGSAHARSDSDQVGRWLGNGILVLAGTGVVVAGIGVTLATFIPGWFGVSGEDGRHLSLAFAVGSVALGGLMLSHVGLAYSRGVQRTGFFTMVTVIGTVAAFVVTLPLLLTGHRLMSIAWGLVARTVVLLVGAVTLLVREVPSSVWSAAEPDRQILGELGRLMPLTALGGLSFAAMSQSELALIGAMFDPALAAAYMATRRASELSRALVDTISWSSYGAFAHIAASAERYRAMHTYRELFTLRDSASVAFAAAFVAANPSFVTAWVGGKLFLGVWLTTAIGIQAVFAGGAFLANYLYRASGAVGRGSAMLFVEAVLRVSLALGLIHAGVGLVAIPIAAISTSLVFWVVARRRTERDLSNPDSATIRGESRMWLIRGALFACAVVCGIAFQGPSWPMALTLAAVFGGGGLLLLLAVDPLADNLRGQLRARLAAS